MAQLTIFNNMIMDRLKQKLFSALGNEITFSLEAFNRHAQSARIRFNKEDRLRLQRFIENKENAQLLFLENAAPFLDNEIVLLAKYELQLGQEETDEAEAKACFKELERYLSKKFLLQNLLDIDAEISQYFDSLIQMPPEDICRRDLRRIFTLLLVLSKDIPVKEPQNLEKLLEKLEQAKIKI